MLAHSGSRGRPAEVSDSELYFLIATFLQTGPCHRAARELQAEVHERGLLPNNETVDRMRLRYSCPPDQLRRLLRRLLDLTISETPRGQRVVAGGVTLGGRERAAPDASLLTMVGIAERVVPQEDQFNTTWAAGVRLSYDVRAAVGTRAKVRTQRAQRRAVNAQIAQLQRGIRMQVVRAANDLGAARRAVDLDRVALQSAEAAYDQVSARYQAGAVGVIDLMEAESLRVEAELRSLESHIAVREQDLRLRHAMGGIDPPSAS